MTSFAKVKSGLDLREIILGGQDGRATTVIELTAAAIGYAVGLIFKLPPA